MARKTHHKEGAPKYSRFFASYTVLVMVSLFLMIPVFLLLLSSLKTGDEFRSFDFKLFPAVPQWRNYIGFSEILILVRLR